MQIMLSVIFAVLDKRLNKSIYIKGRLYFAKNIYFMNKAQLFVYYTKTLKRFIFTHRC